ncbi:putative CDP-diacylglycerol-glycerol-3-phosphate 3-phosphatidyltransferase [Gregarina niphandrodes]|uniref:CDP-diacylglycerol--glycerol-3-phosphate 3-phosphatidyltransferase n=1 Tax=Gregarina niphandrodes TaxID=110365 RepID=A0A023B4R0_GRENI|nr:putative CDP-diacylglycerol-glycerol-3-phosphate 3-phosphatidyltransferase [Gregarina niphandrodes]EZG57239.1 putative CDP-diacylglycerol-glycerol-3-phosphate 3-phosphatidyltransferase [Gregarina niphandrodes]|eukprot:XP_011131072.1 putative CDP-diacylglycerol-glycerol-3-phosphate 3-phosphatidyltransferase [Gregarina niphandrodes]
MPFGAPAARFEVTAENVNVLSSATEFREVLVNKLAAAQRRVIMTSLYIGAEQEQILEQIGRKKREGLEVWTMTDYCRTVRPDKGPAGRVSSSVETMLAVGGEDGWDCYLYQTPVPYRWQRWFPYRMQETLGVLHWKYYIFDDDVIVTGANIATSYLTNRHDRWILVRKNKSLCDALAHIGQLWHGCCHRLLFGSRATGGPAVVYLSGTSRAVYLLQPRKHLNECLLEIERFLPTVCDFGEDCESLDAKHLQDIVRLSLGIHCGYAPEGSKLSWTEPEFIVKALRGPAQVRTEDTTLVLATPYCNLSPETIGLLRTELGDRELRIVGPSPNASSFFDGGPVLSAIPFAYLRLTVRALEALTRVIRVRYSAFLSQAQSTFHAKGIWHVARNQLHGQSAACGDRVLTIAGSTNFGLRSQKRDLECLFLIDTCAPKLVKQFEGELALIESLSQDCSDIRALKNGLESAKWVTRMIAKFFANNSFFRSLL